VIEIAIKVEKRTEKASEDAYTRVGERDNRKSISNNIVPRRKKGRWERGNF